jgi:uncharacterized protein (TIGR03032 family)
MTESNPVGSPPVAPWVEITSSRKFADWLAEQNIGLAFTTYQSGKVFVVGRNPQIQLAVVERTFNRCMGLWADGQSMWMSSLFQLWRFENILPRGQLHDGCDKLYVPKIGYTTGDLDAHDIGVDGSGRVIFVATAYSCLATLSERASFVPLWRPSFVSKLAGEDRCHLNGLAMAEGRPRYVTLVGKSDVADGWREHRRDGGCVLEVPSGQTIAGGLSMPHSPRMHQGKLWILNAGTGFLGRVDTARGLFEPVAFCPGYLRGLAFVNNFAVVGLSLPRHEKTFAGLSLDDNLAARGAQARCGLYVIDLLTGDVAHWLRLEGMVTELYDVAILSGVVRPGLLGFKSDEIQRAVTIGAEGAL